MVPPLSIIATRGAPALLREECFHSSHQTLGCRTHTPVQCMCDTLPVRPAVTQRQPGAIQEMLQMRASARYPLLAYSLQWRGQLFHWTCAEGPLFQGEVL